MLLARLFLISACFAFSSATRLCMICAYSFCNIVSTTLPHPITWQVGFGGVETYSSILTSLSTTTLERDAVALVLQALRSDETLDAGGFGVGLRAFFLGLDFAADDEFADLCHFHRGQQVLQRSDSASAIEVALRAGEEEYSRAGPV